MKFKSWRDYYLFIKEFAKYSCINCKHSSADIIDTSVEHSDGDYARHFCAYHMAMVRWDLQGFLCSHWSSIDDESLPNDDVLFTIDEHILKKLEKGNRKWSIEEIKELL